MSERLPTCLDDVDARRLQPHAANDTVDGSLIESARQHGDSILSGAPVLPDAPVLPGLADLWRETQGDPRVCIAVLDGPVDLSHPCFEGADVAVHPAALAGHASAGPATAHGTHVASVIFGQHHSSVRGIAPRCRGLVVPVFRDGPDGTIIPCSQVDLARAVTLAVEYCRDCAIEALVINISGGQPSESGAAHPLLSDVVEQLDPKRHLVVAAAGNGGCACLQIPGALPSVLAVGAMDRAGRPLPFSNWGPAYRDSGILAPGADILGAVLYHGIEQRTGTSYATPIVSGIAALLLCLQLRGGAPPSARAVRNILLASAAGCDVTPVGDCARLLAGRLDIPQARLILTSTISGVPDMTDDLRLNPASSDPAPAAVLPNATASGVSTERASAEDGTACAVAAPPPPPRAGRPSATFAGAADTLRAADSLVLPAGCACGGACGGGKPASLQKVYAIGKLSYDFGTRQRREYFRSQVPGGNPDDHATLVQRLKETTRGELAVMSGPNFANRTDLNFFTWILQIDATPVYALAPSGAFPLDTHDTLVQFLQDQLPPAVKAVEGERPVKGIHGEGVPRIAICGQIVGETRLYTGETVPVVALDHRGLANWTTGALVEAMKKISNKDVDARVEAILDRLYHMTRNLGIESRDRALNFAATNALILQVSLTDDRNRAKFADMELNDVKIHPSPFCRPDYDCWEVIFTFFDPENLNRARRGIRYTIDVSDTLPQLVAGSEGSFTLN